MRYSRKNIMWISLCLLLISACGQSLPDKEPKADAAISSEIARMTPNNPAYVPPKECRDDSGLEELKPLRISIEDVILSLERNGISQKQFKREDGKFGTVETVTLYFGKNGKNELRMLGNRDGIGSLYGIQLWFSESRFSDNPENKLIIVSLINAIDPSANASETVNQMFNDSSEQIKKINYTSRVCRILNNVYVEHIETPAGVNSSLALFFYQK